MEEDIPEKELTMMLNTIRLITRVILVVVASLSFGDAFSMNKEVRLNTPATILKLTPTTRTVEEPAISVIPTKQQLQRQQQNNDDKLSNNNISTRALASTAILAATILSYPSFSHAAVDVSGAVSSFTGTGFYQAFSLVFVSEIGDKTFFMAGLLAMKTSRVISFVGSIGALIVMTLISVVIGQTFHAVPSGWLGGEGSFLGGVPLDDVAAVIAFAFFGIKTLQEALSLDEDESVFDEELADAEEEVEASDTTKQGTLVARLLSIFGLVFAAEFGDRSFLSTIALSAAQNPVSVAAGAIAAHAVATGIAVSGGAVVAKYLSEKVIGIIGGVLFIIFAVTTAVGVF